jgi:hypothetical protein
MEITSKHLVAKSILSTIWHKMVLNKEYKQCILTHIRHHQRLGCAYKMITKHSNVSELLCLAYKNNDFLRDKPEKFVRLSSADGFFVKDALTAKKLQ